MGGGDKYAGLCVFDYDNTLTRGSRTTDKSCGGHLPSEPHWTMGGERIGAGIYAKKAVQACKLNNMAIGVASAAPCPPPNMPAPPSFKSRIGLLEKMHFPKTVAPGGGKPGPAYVCFHPGVTDKGTEVRQLDKFYGVPASKTIMWDDDKGWLGQVKWGTRAHPEHGQPKAHAVLASSTDGCNGNACEAACGLSKAETVKGLRKVLGHDPRMPPEKKRAHLGGTSGVAVDGVGRRDPVSGIWAGGHVHSRHHHHRVH